MNDALNNVLYGPLGWKIACAVLTLVGIILFIALIDGPWLRGKDMADDRPLPQEDNDDMTDESSDRFPNGKDVGRKSATKLSE